MNSDEKTVIDSLRTMHDVSKAINSTLDIASVEEMLLRKTSQLMGSDRVLILLLEDGKRTLSIHNALGFDPSELPPRRFENIHSFDHCIVHKGSVISLRDVLADDDLRLVDENYPELLDMFFAPLEIQGRAYGLLGVSGREQSFSTIEIEIFCSLGSQAAVAMENAALYKKLHAAFMHTAEALAEAVNSRDPYTGGHTKRVQTYVLRLAEALGLDEKAKNALRLAAILHDIGKIGIDDAILRKGGKLTADEQAKMREHPRIGAKILDFVEEMRDVIPGVLHHHEWYDGSGYPDGLRDEQIPLPARIIAVADAFDALTTDRPYRKGSAPDEAFDLLEKDGGRHFDPSLLAIFRKLQLSPDS